MFVRIATLFLTAALTTQPIAAFAQSETGLVERRAISAYQKDKWPAIEKDIQTAAGFPVPIELDIKNLALPGYADSYSSDDYIFKPIVKPLIKALGLVAADDLGRQALKEKLNGIRITFDEATAPSSNYSSGLTFDNGLLVVNWKPFSNADEFDPRVEALTKALESKL